MGRYEIIDSQNNMPLSDGCPLLIDRLALVNDRLYNTVLARINFKNMSDRQISSLRVEIQCLNDSAWQSIEYIYSDLNAAPGCSFGFDRQICLPLNTYEIKVICIEYH